MLKSGNYFYLAIVLFLIVAVVFRLVWASDMEWKADEKLMYSLAETAVQKSALPAEGMDSGVGLKNAGFSVWPFAGFYFLSSQPITMNRMVMLSNILALFLMLYNASKMGEHKDVFLAAVALVGVNVLMVLFSRKLWAQDLMPIFTAGMWFLHLHRRHMWVLFLLGTISALAGQLHISGFFYGLGLFLAMVWAKQWNMKGFALYVLGFLAGMLPAIGWVQAILAGGSTSNTGWGNIAKLEFFLHALVDPLGINLSYSLGSELFPMVRATAYIPFIAAVILVSITLFAVIRFTRNVSFKKIRPIAGNPLWFYTIGFVLIPGLLLTFSGSPVRSHYLIGAAPFLQAAWAKVWLHSGKKALLAILVCQCLITASFLWYIHQSTGIQGDYGIPFRRQ